MKNTLTINKSIKLLLFSISFILHFNNSWGQTTVFNENFGASAITNYTGGTSSPSTTYTVKNYDGVSPLLYSDVVSAKTVSTSGSPALTLDNNSLVSGTTGATGAAQIVSASTASLFSSPYTSVLTNNTGVVTWTFNLRTSNTANSVGFTTGASYGNAVVLAATDPNFIGAGTGYVVTLERGTNGCHATDVRAEVSLKKYNNGLVLDALTSRAITPVICGGLSVPVPAASTNSDYYSVKVEYNPVTDTWSLSVRNDGATTWGDPTIGTTLKGSAIDTQYVSVDMPYFGFVFKHGTTAGVTSSFDNYKVIVGPVLASSAVTTSTTTLTSFSTTTATPSTSQTFNVTGTGLTANLVVSTTSSDFELSTDNFATAGASSVSVVPTSGSVTATPIYVRLKSGLSAGAKTGALSVTSTGAPAITDVTCTGTVSAVYYYNGSGLLSANTSWGTNTDGSGSNPINVNDSYSQFIIINGSATTDSSWTLGSNSKVIVGASNTTAVVLTVVSTFPIIGTIDISAASSGSNSVLWQDTSSPNFGTLHSSSEVHFSAVGTYTPSTTPVFGKLFIDAAGTVVFANSQTIQTSLNISSSAILSLPFNTAQFMVINQGAIVTVNGSIKTPKVVGVFSFGVATPGTGFGSIQFRDAITTPGILNLGSSSTIECSRANSDQIISVLPTGINYANLTLSEAGATAVTTKTISSPIVVNGKLTINLSTTSLSSISGANNITLGNGATIVRTSGALDLAPTFGNSVNVNYNGLTAISTGVEIPTDISKLNDLLINNSAGVTLTSSATLNGNLIFSSGNLITGSNSLTLGTASTVIGAGATRWVVGSLIKQTASNASPTFTFPIGDATNYAPIALTFNGNNTATSTGTITASTTSGDHPQVASSGIDNANSVNRFWTVSNNGVTGFTDYSATLNYAATDNDVISVPANYVVRKYNASTWTAPTTAATPSASSAVASGLVDFGDFAVGTSTGAPTVSLQPIASSICVGSNTTFTATATTSTLPTTIKWQRSTDGTAWADITANLDAGTTYSNFTTGTLTLTGSTSGLNNYQYRAVFTSINGSTNSNAVAVTVNTTAAPTASAQSFCNSGTVSELTATGTGLQWYSAATGGTALASTTALASGNYFVSQTLNSCEGPRASVAVTVNTTAAPIGAASQSLSLMLTISSIVVTGTNVVWYASSANAASGTNPLPSTTPLTNTTYYATQTVDGCTSATSLAVTITTLANQDFDMSQFSYSPNPVNDLLNLSYFQGMNSVKVYNMVGQELMTKQVNANTAQIDLSNFVNGAYFIQVTSGSAMKIVKIIKR